MLPLVLPSSTIIDINFGLQGKNHDRKFGKNIVMLPDMILQSSSHQ